MLEIKDLKKSYGKKKVLDGVSFSVKKGGICGLLGLNGAGKSTLMKIITSLSFADSGNIFYCGKSLFESLEKKEVSIGCMIESPEFYSGLTGRQNLKALAFLYDGITDARIDSVLSLTGMTMQADKSYKKYSLGMKQRLYFAYAILSEPGILILDEPFNGIDPVTVKLFREILKLLADGGCTIIISGHIIAELKNICDSVCILDGGRVVYDNDDIGGCDIESVFLSTVSGGGLAQ